MLLSFGWKWPVCCFLSAAAMNPPAGIAGNIFPQSRIDFIPQLGKEHTILGGVGDFFDVISIHGITEKYYNTSYPLREEVFLVYILFFRYNIMLESR